MPPARDDLYTAFMLDHAAGALPPVLALAGDLHVLLSHAGAEAGFIWHAAGDVLRAQGADRGPRRRGRSPAPSALDVLERVNSGPRWRRGVLGLASASVGIAGGRLIRVEPGEAVPSHGHGALEATIVIQGGLRDESGYYQEGDLMLAGPGVRHQPAATGHVPCICYAALPDNALMRLI